MNRYFRNLLLAATALLAVQCSPEDPDTRAASELAARVVPDLAGRIEFVKCESTDGVDRFSLRSEGDRLVITGNNAGAMAVGLNYYLKQYCLTEVSWYADEPVELPAELPAVDDEITVDSRLTNRFFLNYCTSGYSMPFWQWRDWERFIDWMALNGVNLPLATTGQEAIWYNVWSRLGLSDEEIRSYFTGPAHLPWHRMCNLDGWQSPLPKEWLEEQAELQKRIITRERELSMRPVLPGFAGHVPEAFAKRYPDAITTTVSEWGGFPAEFRCTYLSPTDTLFAVIQKEYLAEQTRLYGTDHIYGIDPFNEVDPPTWNPDSLAMMSRNIFESVTAVDPEAVWLQMAWILYADPDHWTPVTAKAYLQGVPQGRMMLLDYYCEHTEEWKLFDSFYGQPYIWCYLGNFGGNSFLASPINDVEKRIDDVLANGGSNLCGLGSTLEGLDLNPYVYEYVLSQAWNLPSSYDATRNIIDRRVGRGDSNARQAWQLLVDSVFVQPSLCGQGPLTNCRPTIDGFAWWTVKPNIDYRNVNLLHAWGKMLDVDSCDRDSYVFDCVNLGRQALSNYFIAVREDFADAYQHGDIERLRAKGSEIKELFADLTTLLRGHSGFSLKKWIDDARAHGVTPEQKDYYERNARTLITIWGPSQDLNDYANRQWAELNDSYYAPRWSMFVDRVIAAAEQGKKFDEQEFYNASRDFENAWIEPSNAIRYFDPVDGVATSRAMYEKYAPLIEAHHVSHDPTSHPNKKHW
ncbi:MAG: alpha-N-acetylglucosaminidase [Muribaculaceae bacterium]|nr:alpha-N-acetylglucosaminidase [Muribaculaceae bacterium]